MIIKEENTFWVKIYLSGPIEVAKQIIREYARNNPICVTIEQTTFIYTGGEEAGYCVGLIQYPRFPTDETEIWGRADMLAFLLMEKTYQDSALIMSPYNTKWMTRREP